MAVECTNCGTRSPDGTTRCPQCLRSTGLLAVAELVSTKPGNTRRVVALVAVFAMAGAGAATLALRARPPTPRRGVIEHTVDLHGLPPPLAVGTGSSWLRDEAARANDPLARLRAVADAVQHAVQARGTHVVTDADDVPPARSLDAIATALRAHDARVTTLDLARLEVGTLRAVGTQAEVVEQTLSLRREDPPDPSAVLGRYAVTVGEQGVDVLTGTVVPSRELRPHALDAAALAAAELVQAAVAGTATGARADTLVPMVDEAVRAWSDSAVPLAARALVVLTVGASGGTQLALQDMASAASMQDSAPMHLLRARVALAGDDLGVFPGEVRAAFRIAPTWGPAALAVAVVGLGADAGDRCSPLGAAREDWAVDALLVCRAVEHGTVDGDIAASMSAQRLLASAYSPLRLAWAAAAGAQGVPARVHASDRHELAAWLALLGRGDLARDVLGIAHPDAGH